MKKLALVSFAILIGCLWGCNNENEDNEGAVSSKYVTFLPDATRNNMVEGVYHNWTKNDVVGVFCAQTTPVGSNTKVAYDGSKFASTLEWASDSTDHTFYMYYPYNGNITSPAEIHGVLNARQTQTADETKTDEDGNDFRYSVLKDVTRPYDGTIPFNMKPLFATLNVLLVSTDNAIKDLAVKKVTVTAGSDVFNYGDYTVDLTAATVKPTFTAGSTTDEISVDVSNITVGTAGNTHKVFLTYCPSTSLNSVVVSVQLSDNSVVTKNVSLSSQTYGSYAYTTVLLKKAVSAAKSVKNVIFMIGDGMGPAHVTSLLLKQNFTDVNIMRATSSGFNTTYSLNQRITDSAAAGTALATGYKTNNGVISQSPDGEKKYTSTMTYAKNDKLMATGIIVTTVVTDATPAVFYSHSSSRGNTADIASQFVSSKVDVLFGGGKSSFTSYLADIQAAGYTIADNLSATSDIHSGKVFGLFYPGDMPRMKDGRGDYLPKATEKALEILGTDGADKGFFLMVEGSCIDKESHSNNYELMLLEMKDFDDAVGVAMDYADTHPGTLVVICADHETGGLSVTGADSYKFSTTGHTAAMTPVYAYGTGAENFTGIMDNTEMPKKVLKLLGFIAVK